MQNTRGPAKNTTNSRGRAVPCVSQPVFQPQHSSMVLWEPCSQRCCFGRRVSGVLRAAVIKTAAPFEGIELLTSMTPDKFKPD